MRVTKEKGTIIVRRFVLKQSAKMSKNGEEDCFAPLAMTLKRFFRQTQQKIYSRILFKNYLSLRLVLFVLL
jgi:hypothetical protein